MRRFAGPFFLVVGLLGTPACVAQFAAGITGGTWEGIWGVGTQPAAMLLHQDRAEINVFRLGADVHNSFLELRSEGVGLFGFNNRVTANTSTDQVTALGTSDRAVMVDLRVMGPSFACRLGKHDALAFTTQVRTSFVALDLDRIARKFGVDTLHIEPGRTRRLDDITARAAAASWLEFGPTYGHSFKLGQKIRLHTGATLKYAMGIVGSSIHLEPPVLSGLNDSVQTITGVDLDYAIAIPEKVQPTGQGWNGDAGFVLEFLRRDSIRSVRSYWLRIGAAVTDIGSITFNRNARIHRIRQGATTVEELNALRINTVDQLDTALSSLLLNDPNASRIGTSFKIGLPAALHASVDISPWGAWALRFEVVRSLRSAPAALSTRDQVSIVPRYETRLLCIAVPITFDRYGNAGIGLCMRLSSFMIGSDRIGGLFGLNDVTGADVYFGAKVRLRSRH